jgi:hypothetical protein
MRQSQRRRVAAGLVAIYGLVGSLGLGAQAGDPISPPVVRTLISRITTIDPDTFSLTLDEAELDELFTAGPALRDVIAPHIIGEFVQVTFYDALVVRIAIGGGGSLPAGVRPGQSAAVRPALRDGTVTAVDPLARSITVILSDSGRERTFDVIHEALLVGVQVGDTVTLTVSHPLLTDVTFLP